MNESNELTVVQQAVMPIMSIQNAVTRHKQMVGFVKEIMRAGVDFGTVPGTNKPTLLKPGAEKLTTFFGLVPRFVPVNVTELWGDDGSEPLFYYHYKCELYRNGVIVGEGDGSCSSREGKYRYRKLARKCPRCGSEAIIKGKEEYGGGWLCWGKKGGCGAKFKDNDRKIKAQKVGRVLNDDIASIVNTILKMAQKRALVAATLITVNASEFFTQDMEDIAYDDVINVTPSQTATPQAQPANGNGGNGKIVHWIDSKTRNGKPVHAMFWAWTTGDCGLSDDEVHTALGVEHIRDFAGDMGQAKTKIEAWIVKQGEAQEPPAEELTS